MASVRLNRFQQQTYTVVVPWTNKELTIEKELPLQTIPRTSRRMAAQNQRS
ncbi:MAG: hypothetical protein IPL33_20140 [Sphingobacteriales bacterium]|nr:hypothetical protein [Sphingobacteriales bacterium]